MRAVYLAGSVAVKITGTLTRPSQKGPCQTLAVLTGPVRLKEIPFLMELNKVQLRAVADVIPMQVQSFLYVYRKFLDLE